MASTGQAPAEYRAFAVNQIWIIASHVLIYARGIILLPILVKNLGPSLYGSWILLVATADLVFGLSGLGVDYRFRREMPSAAERARRSELFWFQFLVHAFLVLLACAGLFLFSGPLARGFDIAFNRWLLCTLVLATFVFSKLADYLRYTDRQGLLAVVLPANPYLNILFILTAVYGMGVIGIDLLLVLSTSAMVASVLPVVPIVLREIGFRLPRFSFAEFRQNIALGFPITLSFFIEFILSNSDRYVIGWFLTTTAVGFYSPAYAIGALIILFPKALGIVMPPILSRLEDTGRADEAETVVRHAIRSYLAIALPFVACSVVAGRAVLALFTTAAIGDASAMIVPVIAIGITLHGVTLILMNVFFVKRKTTVIFRASLIAALMNLILNLILIPMTGDYKVAALTTLASYTLVFVYVNYQVSGLFRVVYETGVIMRIAACGLAAAAILWGLLAALGDGLAGLVVAIPVTMGVYFGMLLLTGAYTRDELREFAGLLRRGA